MKGFIFPVTALLRRLTRSMLFVAFGCPATLYGLPKQSLTPRLWLPGGIANAGFILEEIHGHVLGGSSAVQAFEKQFGERVDQADDYSEKLLEAYLQKGKLYQELTQRMNHATAERGKYPVVPLAALPDLLNLLLRASQKETSRCQAAVAADEAYLAGWYAQPKAPIRGPNPALLLASDQVLEDGYGEYIFFKQGGGKLAVDEFAEVYTLFGQQPKGIVAIKAWIAQQQKRDWKVIFLPRTLYDLMLMEPLLEEEKEHGGCTLLALPIGMPAPDKGKGEGFDQFYTHLAIDHPDEASAAFLDHCWHITGFQEGYEKYKDTKKNAFLVQTLTYRANNFLVAKYKIQNERFLTGQKIGQILAALEASFINLSHKTKRKPPFSGNGLCASLPGTIAALGGNTDVGHAQMEDCEISTSDREVIQNSIALECSEQARGCYLLYRSVKLAWGKVLPPSFFMDTALRAAGSRCFGTSLFAGWINDDTACVYAYYKSALSSTKPPRYISVLRVPYAQAEGNSAFYIPPFWRGAAQLNGRGELFHPRTKVYIESKRDPKEDSFNGVCWTFMDDHAKGEVFSRAATAELTPKQLADQVNRAIDQMVVLTGRQQGAPIAPPAAGKPFVGLAVVAATIGAVAAAGYFYLRAKRKRATDKRLSSRRHKTPYWSDGMS